MILSFTSSPETNLEAGKAGESGSDSSSPSSSSRREEEEEEEES